MKKYPVTNPKFQKINNSLYQIIAEESIDKFKDVNGYKKHINCDIVFKENKSGKYIFCRLVDEAEIL
jgi:hypothetical protein